MALIPIFVNGRRESVEADPDTPLLWILRDTLGLTGTKYSCGAGLCGACTVHVGGEAVRSCSITIRQVEGRSITTIEGLAAAAGNPLIQAWIAEQVAQCGYCQPGFIMTVAALLSKNPNPSDVDLDSALAANLCRCGSYPRVRAAIHRAAGGPR